MIKKILTPQQNSYNLSIPPNYIGKKIEILIYALDEVVPEKFASPKKTFSDFCGILSESDYQSLKAHSEEARKEWNRDI
ncbi:MAG: hypothetical protein SFU91_05720 [Chloroherpetonaceae bacterium]|nr:hypothetical protein [Chloroherpetonaceae bacterium]